MTDRAEIRRRFAELDSATIADVLDELGVHDQGLASGFRAMSGNRLAGWAYTIHGICRPAPQGGDPAKMEACNGIGPDEVAVWSGDGDGFAYFGELIAAGMAERGCVGALVQGGVRDRRWLEANGFACFALFASPVQSIGRWVVDAWQQPVALPGATVAEVEVCPGDFVLADEDGAIAVPAGLVQRVLERAEELTSTEVEIRADLARGRTLAEVLEKYGHV